MDSIRSWQFMTYFPGEGIETNIVFLRKLLLLLLLLGRLLLLKRYHQKNLT